MAIRKIIEIDKEKCDACGACIPSCAENALFIENNELKIIEDRLCDGLGACLNACPKDALKLIEREAADYDHAEVERRNACLSSQEIAPKKGCPSLQEVSPKQDMLQTYTENSAKLEEGKGNTNWPVKLALVSPKVAFIKEAKLCIASDCSAFACMSYHKRYTNDRVSLIACPRLENKDAMVEKLVEILHASNTKDISIIRMEVPCCVLVELVDKAIKQSGLEGIKVQVHIVTRDGKEQMPKLFGGM